jgi:hypothetical protein
MPQPALQEYPPGKQVLFKYFYYRNIFCSKLIEKTSELVVSLQPSDPCQRDQLPSHPSVKMFILVATF